MLVRQRVRQFASQYAGYIEGGIYSLETTFNRQEKTWHIHCHMLADCSASLPQWSQKLDLGGGLDFAFMALKLRMEFDWLRLWTTKWGKEPRANATRMAIDGDRMLFGEWCRLGRAHALKVRVFSRAERRMVSVPIEGLSQAELVRRTSWNKCNRRLVDIRRVHDRNGAACEVLKYITKAAMVFIV